MTDLDSYCLPEECDQTNGDSCASTAESRAEAAEDEAYWAHGAAATARCLSLVMAIQRNQLQNQVSELKSEIEDLKLRLNDRSSV